MSRVGHCIDNGPTEVFCGIIKSEMYCIYTMIDAKSLICAIKQYIDFYNKKRFQERFAFKTPKKARQEAFIAYEAMQYPIPANKRTEKYKEKMFIFM